MAKSNTGSSNKLLAALIVLGLALVVAAVVNFIFVARLSSEDAQFLGHLDEQAVLSQTMVKNAERAIAGKRDGFQDLAHVRDRFSTTLDGLREGIPEGMLVESPETIRSEVLRLADHWSSARGNIETILGSRDSVMVAHNQLDVVQESMPQLLSQLDMLAETLTEGGASEKLVYHVGRQGFYGQRMLQSANDLVTGTGDASQAASRLNADTQYFGRVWAAFFAGDPNLEISPIQEDTEAYRILEETDLIYGRVDDGIQTILSMEDALIQNHEAVNALRESSELLLSDINTIDDIYQSAIESRLVQPEYGYILGGAGIVVFGLLIFIYNLTSDTRRAAALQAEQNERNQEAILRLLDELGSLADGDLTVQVSVTEDITGAIADSINYAIEALRDLVTTINDTAVRVDSTAQQTRATASHLAEASDNQSREIISASEQISDMAKSIEQVSANAERSTRVAQQSVEIAHKGGDAVRRTIEGMNNIRETIQETSKRIKRLGESSQEIGDIVELINDIAEQTNILALNAAIQASMAGEAGRGFAVVADEVQRLAERSGNATRQIEALVKTIQTDTNEAVISMEHSTAGVVSGAQLAENAGEALDEIEKVSNHIATLIQSISNAARQQATAAADVSRTMNVIQEITSQTAEGTTATAQNIGKLADLATELRKSVAGFKLPGMDDEETMVMSPEKAAAQFGDTHKLSRDEEIPDVDEAVSYGQGDSVNTDEDAFAFEENPEAESGESSGEGSDDEQDRQYRENV